MENEDDYGHYLLSQYKYNKESIEIITDKFFKAYKEEKADIIKKDKVNKLYQILFSNKHKLTKVIAGVDLNKFNKSSLKKLIDL